MLLSSCAHAFDQGHRIRGPQKLPLMMMRERRERIVNKLDPPAIEQRPVASYGNEYRPTAVIRHANDCAFVET